MGTLFLPVTIVPAYAHKFAPERHIYSGPTRDAIDRGVVAPQEGCRLSVLTPATRNEGWTDVSGAGPVSIRPANDCSGRACGLRHHRSIGSPDFHQAPPTSFWGEPIVINYFFYHLLC